MSDVQDKISELLGLENTDAAELRTEIERTPWAHTYLQMAIHIAGRSHDAQTKNGCVLVRDNTVLSTGYNGFIRDIDDTVLPNLRPYKYPWMMHAEHNAILNCARNGVSTLGATSYQTGVPCSRCLQFMWQAGIDRIVYTNYSQNVMVDDEDSKRREALLLLINPVEVVYENFPIPAPTVYKRTRLVLEFIDKKCVLPQNEVDKP